MNGKGIGPHESRTIGGGSGPRLRSKSHSEGRADHTVMSVGVRVRRHRSMGQSKERYCVQW